MESRAYDVGLLLVSVRKPRNAGSFDFLHLKSTESCAPRELIAARFSRGVVRLSNVEQQHEYFMKRALELAARALGRTSPNPVVGAVIVKDGKVVGEGYHARAGTAHAEVVALQQAGEAARDGVMYVTLEPCNHKGKTPPCTEAVIGAGIRTVYAAILDPNPLVAGKGVKRLQDAGIEVHTGLLEQEAARLNEFFFKFITTGMPFVAVKTAMSLDGKIATRSGDSKWITGEPAREFVHRLRDQYDAILVGIGTVLADNPRLNTRLASKPGRDPVRLIVDGRLEVPLDSNVVQTARQQKTVIYCSMHADRTRIEALKALGVDVVPTTENEEKIPLETILRDVAQRGLTSVLIEGGSRMNAYAFEHNLVDKVFWFIAPRIIGGAKAIPPVAGRGAETVAEALVLRNTELTTWGDDLLITGYTR